MLAASQTFHLRISRKYKVPNSLHNTYCRIDNEERLFKFCYIQFFIIKSVVHQESGFTNCRQTTLGLKPNPRDKKNKNLDIHKPIDRCSHCTTNQITCKPREDNYHLHSIKRICQSKPDGPP